MGNPEAEHLSQAPPTAPGYPEAPPPYAAATGVPVYPGQPGPPPGQPSYAPPGPSQPYSAPQPGPMVNTVGPVGGQPVYAQPVGGYPSAEPGQPVIINQPVIIQQQRFGHHPIMTICPFCQHQGMTKVDHESGLGTWLVAGGICCFGLWAGCCLIPFCINDLKDARHQCPNCKKTIKVKKLIS